MGNIKKYFDQNTNSKSFAAPWYNPKHAHSQVNGETQLTQNTIILQRQTRKQS
jgi:YpzG-like protein